MSIANSHRIARTYSSDGGGYAATCNINQPPLVLVGSALREGRRKLADKIVD
jgi:hypothetical protein